MFLKRESITSLSLTYLTFIYLFIYSFIQPYVIRYKFSVRDIKINEAQILLLRMRSQMIEYEDTNM